jgi:PcfJ-like protein
MAVSRLRSAIDVEPVALHDGARLVVRLRSTFALRLRVARPAECVVEGGRGAARGWPLWRGLPVAFNFYDPFQQAVRWAAVQMLADRPDRRPDASVLRRIYAESRALAVHAADRCDPDARRIALRFLPHARWFVYQRLTWDRSGRLAQLAASCPGAVLFALALRDCSGSDEAIAASERLLAGAVAGRKLKAILDEALESWLRLAEEPREPLKDAPWARVRAAAPAERERIRRQQRLLVRRASSRVPTTLLWLPPPLHFAPEDIPPDVRGTAAWFRATKAAALMGPHPRLSEEAQLLLSAFCSRHAVALKRLAHEGVPVLRHEIIDHVAATGRAPERDSSPERVVADARRWHAEMAQAQGVADLGGQLAIDGLHDIREDTPLPAAPFPAWSDHEISVRPLTTVGELFAEGRKMRHCVASYLGSILSGTYAIYSATVRDAPLTIALRTHGPRWYLAELKRFANREPTCYDHRAVARWLASAGATTIGPGRCG